MVIEYRIRIGGGSTITQSVDLGNCGTAGPIPQDTATAATPATKEPIQDAGVSTSFTDRPNRPRPPRPQAPGHAGDDQGAGESGKTGTGGGLPGSGVVIVFGPMIFLGQPPEGGGGEAGKTGTGGGKSAGARTDPGTAVNPRPGTTAAE
jgi:hypothetical protein